MNSHRHDLTNHALLVLALAAWPNLTIRQLAERIGITERATYALLRELERASYLSRRREGKLVIDLHLDMALADPLLHDRTLDDLVGWCVATPGSRAVGRTAP
jgi:DNA-binding transcriptional ArsR family regulator